VRAWEATDGQWVGRPALNICRYLSRVGGQYTLSTYPPGLSLPTQLSIKVNHSQP
jgi:hypothetical protein